MRIFILDGKDMKNREKAYRVIERTLGFPEWFGHNLDALADCLGELDTETAIVFVNTQTLCENLGSYADKLLACFREVSEAFNIIYLEKA
ncbi:MAG: barstar family protein [Firmicutes bacterium]|nr:barstar family protein [Bacillota bacterium]